MAAPHHETPQNQILAPGYAELTFAAPEAGTYVLPPLWTAKDGAVLDTEGKQRRLHEFMTGKFTLLSFIYTSCSDVNGCPLASYVLNKVQERVAGDDALKDYVQLLSISFDRMNDSPAHLKTYGAKFSREAAPDWQFLTTASDADLDEILTGYDQFIIEDVDEAGQKVGTLSHVLRVYLIDHEQVIRNIYSVSFLHPDIIINDIKTIVADATAQSRTET